MVFSLNFCGVIYLKVILKDLAIVDHFLELCDIHVGCLYLKLTRWYRYLIIF